MPLSADIAINYTTKVIRKTGTMGSQFYTVRDFYSYLMDVFFQAAQMDDDGPMLAPTPFDYTMVKGWYIEQGLIQNLRGGTIKTVGYQGAIQVITLQSSGYTNFNSAALDSQVSDDGSPIGPLLDYDNTQRKIWVRAVGAVANGSAITVAAGTGAGTSTGASATGEEQFSNVFTLGTVANGNAYVMQNGVVLTSWWGVGNADGVGGTSGNHIDVLIKIMEAGTEIDGGKITIFNRNYGDTYDHVEVDLTSGGRTPAALATTADINNTTAEATVAGWVDADHGGGDAAGILVTFGTFNADVNDDGTNEAYTAQVDCDGRPLAQVYEALKWLCDKDRASGTVLNSVYGQVYISANSAYTPSKASPFGTFAGGKLFGARGVLFVNMDAGDASNYQTIDNAGNTRTPPATVSVQVTGLQSGDQVFQATVDGGGAVVKNTYTLASGNDNGDGTVTITGTINNDTPASGYLRIVRAGSFEHRYAYTSYNRTSGVFTLSATLSQNYLNTDTLYVPFLDEAASGSTLGKSIKYVANRDTVVRVRRGTGGSKIVPYEVAATIGSNGSSVPALRISDTVNSNA